MTGFATTVEFRMHETFSAEARCAAPGERVTVRASNDPDRVTIQRRLESGLDRLLRDIEKFEELERWDGMA